MNEENEFDKHLESMHKSRYCSAPEIEAAVLTFERLKTAQIICQSIFPDAPSQTVVAAVFSELCAEARGQASDAIA